MVTDQDRRIAWLERELDTLRAVSTEALAAYNDIGMGKGGWKARDREAFADLDFVLRRPRAEVVTAEERYAHAVKAVEIFLATHGPNGVALNAPLWVGIVTLAEMAVPGLRQAMVRWESDASGLIPEETRPAMLAAAAMIQADVREGFPGEGTLNRLEALALAARIASVTETTEATTPPENPEVPLQPDPRRPD